MGLNSLNLSDAFMGVLAQRLTRKLCRNCRKAYALAEDEYEMIRRDYGDAYFDKNGVQYNPGLTLYRHEGCEECSHPGYSGRRGIHELMEGTSGIKLMIKNQRSGCQILISD